MRADSGDPGLTAPRLPEPTGSEPLADGVRLHLSIPSDLAWFQGHFPSRRVLPGVAQIAWVVFYSREQFDFDRDPTAIDRVKFLEPVPLDKGLLLDLHRGANRVTWQLLADDALLSRGRLVF